MCLQAKVTVVYQIPVLRHSCLQNCSLYKGAHPGTELNAVFQKLPFVILVFYAFYA